MPALPIAPFSAPLPTDHVARAETVSFSPDDVLRLAQRLMAQSNQQIASIGRTLEDKAQAAEQLSREIESLERLRSANRGGDAVGIFEGDDTTSDGVAECGASARAMTEAGWLTAGGDGVEDLTDQVPEDVRAAMHRNDNGTTILTTAQIGDLIEVRRQELNRVNSGTEMHVMTLQNVLQQRSSYVQTCTQLIASHGETIDSILRNL